jgi:hypothetical protein
MVWIAARRHAFFRAVFGPRGSSRRQGADQTRDRGGYSGGGRPKPSRQKSLCGRATSTATAKGGWNRAIVRPAKHLLVQAAMKMHLSQPTGAGAFDGQQGMSFAILSVVAEADMSSAADIDASATMPAMAGRANGARTSPAIIAIASSRRMVVLQGTPQIPIDVTKREAFSTNAPVSDLQEENIVAAARDLSRRSIDVLPKHLHKPRRVPELFEPEFAI